jgi:hypothetical protein
LRNGSAPKSGCRVTCHSGLREKIVQGDYLVCTVNAIMLRKIRHALREYSAGRDRAMGRFYFASAYRDNNSWGKEGAGRTGKGCWTNGLREKNADRQGVASSGNLQAASR